MFVTCFKLFKETSGQCITDYFRTLFPTYTTSHLHICNSLFFYTYTSVLQFFKPLFSLANHCSQACNDLAVFRRKKLFCLSMKVQFQFQFMNCRLLTNTNKMLGIFFSYARNAIYTFTNPLLRMQI